MVFSNQRRSLRLKTPWRELFLDRWRPRGERLREFTIFELEATGGLDFYAAVESGKGRKGKTGERIACQQIDDGLMTLSEKVLLQYFPSEPQGDGISTFSYPA